MRLSAFLFEKTRQPLRRLRRVFLYCPPLTPEEIILDEENRSILCAALDQLPPIQARRVYAHYILGKKKSEIARAENVVESSICDNIRRGVKNLAEILKNLYG